MVTSAVFLDPHGEERRWRVSNHEAPEQAAAVRAFILRDASLRDAPQDEGRQDGLPRSSG
jgi:hypothetical protein